MRSRRLGSIAFDAPLFLGTLALGWAAIAIVDTYEQWRKLRRRFSI